MLQVDTKPPNFTAAFVLKLASTTLEMIKTSMENGHSDEYQEGVLAVAIARACHEAVADEDIGVIRMKQIRMQLIDHASEVGRRIRSGGSE